MSNLALVYLQNIGVAPLQNETAPKSFEFQNKIWNEKWNRKFENTPKRPQTF